MTWIRNEHSKTVKGNQDLVWNHLVKALGLPEKIDLPYYEFIEPLSPNQIREGMRWKIRALNRAIREAELSVWQPQEKRLLLTIYSTYEHDKRSWVQNDFSVHPSSEAEKSEILFITNNRELDFWVRLKNFKQSLDRKKALKIGIGDELTKILRRFPSPNGEV